MWRRIVGAAPWLLIFAVVAAAISAGSTAFAQSLDLIGSADPGSNGLNTMAVGLDNFAYLGSWGSPAQCPSYGVRVFDIHDPTNPSMVATAAVYQGTTAEHVAAVKYATTAFSGNVLFAGIQRCNAASAADSGLAVWDITDPTNPSELAFLPTGRGVRGVHEFTVGRRDDRWYAYLAVPNSEAVGGEGDLRVVDVTDPRQPTELTDWGARKDAGLPIGTGSECAPACRGAVPQVFLHSVALSPDGRTAYLSYWDLGVIMLDVSEPKSPHWLGRYEEPSTAEGNTHSVALAREGKLALVADETYGPPWGRLRLVDVQDPTNPAQLGTFDTPNSAAGTPGEQYAYTIHNPLVDDRNPNHAYLAWYADGVRLLDISDPSRPVELASWVPPHGGLVWSVFLMGDLVLVGDIDNGLEILQRV
jgi:hypothetical protein